MFRQGTEASISPKLKGFGWHGYDLGVNIMKVVFGKFGRIAWERRRFRFGRADHFDQ